MSDKPRFWCIICGHLPAVPPNSYCGECSESQPQQKKPKGCICPWQNGIVFEDNPYCTVHNPERQQDAPIPERVVELSKLYLDVALNEQVSSDETRRAASDTVRALAELEILRERIGRAENALSLAREALYHHDKAARASDMLCGDAPKYAGSKLETMTRAALAATQPALCKANGETLNPDIQHGKG